MNVARLSAFAGYGNITLSKISYSNPLLHHPLFLLSTKSNPSIFQIHFSKFNNVASNVIRAHSRALSLTYCDFTNSLQPIHLESAKELDFRSKQTVNADLAEFEKCSFTSLKSIEEVNSTGGAIFCCEYAVTFRNCIFVENSATIGGAAHFENSTVTIEGSNFSTNIAGQTGGAINGQNSIFRILDSNFIGNSAEIGGAMHIISSKKFELEGCIFCRNRAVHLSGGISFHGTHYSKVLACQFSGQTIEGKKKPMSISISLVQSQVQCIASQFEGAHKIIKPHVANDHLSTISFKMCCFDSPEDDVDRFLEGGAHNLGLNKFGQQCDCAVLQPLQPYDVHGIKLEINSKNISTGFMLTNLSFVGVMVLMVFYMGCRKDISSIDKQRTHL